MAAAPGRLTEAYESGGKRPSWKRGGKAACFYVHAPKLEARRQGGWLLRPRAQAGSAAARRPASTSTRPSWKRGGKAACFYVHAPKLETRREGVAGFYVHAPKLETRRRQGPSWKRGGKAAGFYVHAPKLEARRQGGLACWPAVVARSEGVAPALFVGASPERRIERARSPAWIIHAPQAGNAAVRWPASRRLAVKETAQLGKRKGGPGGSGQCGLAHSGSDWRGRRGRAGREARGRIALARFDRRDGRQRGSSTRPSWKRGGARWPASTSTRPSWKRGGKAASCCGRTGDV